MTTDRQLPLEAKDTELLRIREYASGADGSIRRVLVGPSDVQPDPGYHTGFAVHYEGKGRRVFLRQHTRAGKDMAVDVQAAYEWATALAAACVKAGAKPHG